MGKLFYTVYLTCMYKSPISLAACLMLLLSCKNNVEVTQWRAVNESLQEATAEIQRDNEWIYQAMGDKLKDPQTKSKAEIWQRKAAEIKRLSGAMTAYIDTLKTALEKQAGLYDSSAALHDNRKIVFAIFNQQGNAAKLSAKLVTFKRLLIEGLHPEQFPDNPYLQKDLISYSNRLQLTLLRDVNKSTEKRQMGGLPVNEDPIQGYFRNASVWASVTILDKIRNDIARAENNI